MKKACCVLLPIVFGAASFVSFSQPLLPVDLLTGRADVTVPLGSVSEGDLTVPVFLSYDASGVKPQQAGGNAGVNWFLVAGGSISREVRSLPDDYTGTTQNSSDARRGWLQNGNAATINSFVPAADDNLTSCNDELADWTFINNLGYTIDSEPDVFSFSAPGLQGQFVFGTDGQPKLIPYQDVKITLTYLSLSIIGFVITRNDGVKYSFLSSQKTTRQTKFKTSSSTQFLTNQKYYYAPLEFTSAWYLTKIESPTGASVTFCYGSCAVGGNVFDEVAYSGSGVIITNTSSTATSAAFPQNSMEDVTTVNFLSAITTGSQRVEFLYDHPNLVRKIDFIDRISGNRKAFKLELTPVKKSGEWVDRKFLRKVIETTTSCESFPAFAFDYYDVTFGTGLGTTSLSFTVPEPNQPVTKLDYWGYFNNVAQSKNPTLYFYNGRQHAERYRYYPLPGVPETAKITGADRSVNPTTVMYGSLKKITYPSGGYAELTYEPNQYFDAEAGISQYGPGIRVQKVEYKDPVGGAPTTTWEYEYKAANGTSSGKMVYRSVFGYHDVNSFFAVQDDLSPDPTVLYERVTTKQAGLGKTVYEYLLPGTYPQTFFAPDWNASKTKVARATCLSTGQLATGFYLHPFAVNTNYEFERGLVSKITDYQESGNMVRERAFTYQRLAAPTVIVKGLRFEKLNGTTNISTGANTSANLFVYSQYALLANTGKVLLTETIKQPDDGTTSLVLTSTTQHTFSNAHHLLSHVTTTNSDNVTYKTRYKYAKDFSTLTNPNTSDNKSVMVKKLNDDFRHGTVVESIESIINGGTETVTGASLTLFGSYADSLGNVRALPRETRIYTGTTGYAEANVTPATGANQVLNFNTNTYRPAQTVQAYDFIGNPQTITDASKNVQAVHYGYRKSVAVAAVANAAHNEVVLAGFESYTGGEFTTVPAGVTYTEGWTGRKAAQLGAGMQLQRTGITKGRGQYYKFSCYLKATAARQVTFKVNNNASWEGVASYASGDVGTWKYLEGTIDMSSVPATFTLTFETNGTATVDDIAFYPLAASVKTTTHEPLRGISSETNSNGVSVFYEYDNLGRLRYTRDQDKGIREFSEYYFNAQPLPVILAPILASHEVHQVVQNATVDYTSSLSFNCGISPLTYDWYVDDVKLGANTNNFQYQFTQVKKYVLKLVVSHPVYPPAASTIVYDVKSVGSGPFTAVLTNINPTDPNSYALCDADYSKTFSVSLSGCFLQEDVTINWYYKKASESTWTSTAQLPTQGAPIPNSTTLSFNPATAFGANNLAAYQIKCEASTVCPLTGTPYWLEQTLYISYNGSTQCN
jgi:hypothetical protein